MRTAYAVYIRYMKDVIIAEQGNLAEPLPSLVILVGIHAVKQFPEDNNLGLCTSSDLSAQLLPLLVGCVFALSGEEQLV